MNANIEIENNYFPQRIVCITEETTELLYLLGEEKRIVGISGFTVRPKLARKEKPKVSTFIDANIEEILSLSPDLVIGFSDIQANIAQQLIAKGVTVWINNYRDIEGIFQMIAQVGSLVGAQKKAFELINQYKSDLENINKLVCSFETKPKVYFEEWFDPLIFGIRWVSELVEIAGGEDIFGKFGDTSLAKNRILANSDIIIEKNPDIIIASWCGKKFKKEKLLARAGWGKINAVKNDFIFEIYSSIILQPGPAALTDGINAISKIILDWHKNNQTKKITNPE